jgi:hypothetical protein
MRSLTRSPISFIQPLTRGRSFASGHAARASVVASSFFTYARSSSASKRGRGDGESASRGGGERIPEVCGEDMVWRAPPPTSLPPPPPPRMASISFAQPGDAPGFFPNTFEPAGGASFQMNPLSAHPPRAPRASHDTYAPEPEPLHEVEVDADDERTRKRAARLRREAVWRDMLATSTGRDKAFKVLQYGLKLYLLFHTSLAATRLVRRPRAGAWDHTLLERLDVAVGKLSLSRCPSPFSPHPTLHLTGTLQEVPDPLRLARAARRDPRPAQLGRRARHREGPQAAAAQCAARAAAGAARARAGARGRRVDGGEARAARRRGGRARGPLRGLVPVREHARQPRRERGRAQRLARAAAGGCVPC